MILESAALERILRGREPLATDFCFSSALVRDARLAQRFVELHRALETPSWALERETLLADWLRDVGDGTQTLDYRRRAARRDPALRRACELLGDELAGNVTLDELARAAGVSRHWLQIVVPDAAEASAWYANAFGAQGQPHPAAGRRGDERRARLRRLRRARRQ